MVNASRIGVFLAAVLLGSPWLSEAGETAVPVSFEQDVMAVLSRAGCNQGICHGNQNGKGGFRLSLRGQDPDADFLALTRGASGRRLNRVRPDESLLLQKPTMQVPHEGGRRFADRDLHYRILRDWIAAGTPRHTPDIPPFVSLEVSPRELILTDPDRTFSLQVTGRFGDGSQRRLEQLAVYEVSAPIVEVDAHGRGTCLEHGETTIIVRYLHAQVPVRIASLPRRDDFTWTAPPPANVIDEAVYAKLQKLNMRPSEVATDTVFLRRVFLDLLGIPPTADEARAFQASTDPSKRRRLIDALLQRPEFADFWAQKWADLLRAEEKTLDRKGIQNYYGWIRQQIVRNTPIDQFVRELIASRGSTYLSPAANYYRSMREPLLRAESTAQLFLGVRLQCAKCHNHPFDQWTQADYYSWANLFATVDYKILENRRRDRNDKHEFDGEQIVFMNRTGSVSDPRTGAPVVPRFLGSDGYDPRGERDRLEQLAVWLTSPDNRQFATVQANRIWYHLFGRGIVDPIDDFRSTNLPSNPALLEAITEALMESGYDLRALIRLIANSRTYQLDAIPNDSNQQDDINFSHQRIRRLTAEQLVDSLSVALDAQLQFNGYPPGTRAGQIPGVRAVRVRDARPSEADQFLTVFGKPPRLQTCECERNDDTTLNQAFQLISGPLLNELLLQSGNRLDQLLTSPLSDVQVIDELFWSSVSRAPSASERARSLAHLQSSSDRRRALEDIAWALLNSSEVLFRR